MNTEENLKREEIRGVWEDLLNVAWQHSDRFDRIRGRIEGLEHNGSTAQLSLEERELQNIKVTINIPRIQEGSRRGEDVQLNTTGYYISQEMLEFQSEWHSQQERFIRILIDGLSSGAVRQEEMSWFFTRLDATTGHHQRQLQSLVKSLNEHLTAGPSEKDGEGQSPPQLKSTKPPLARCVVTEPPELKSAGEVLREIASDMNASLKKIRAEQRASEEARNKCKRKLSISEKRLESNNVLVRKKTGARVHAYADQGQEIESEQGAVAYGVQSETARKRIHMHGPRVIKFAQYVQKGRTPTWVHKAALHGLLLDIDREYPPSPFAE
jgi:hypothetical protein